MSGEQQHSRQQERQTAGTHRHKARSLQPSPACKFGQLTLQMSSRCPVAKSGCSEKTDWDRSVGKHKTLLRHPLHQGTGLSYWSPFKRLNRCRVSKQTVKEMAEILIPFHLFRLLLFFPLPQLRASVPSPEVLKQQSSKDRCPGSMLGSIFSRYTIACSREEGEGRLKATALYQQSQTHINPQGLKGCKSFLITEGRAYNNVVFLPGRHKFSPSPPSFPSRPTKTITL